MKIKKFFVCFIGIITPLIIFGSSLVALNKDKGYFLAKYTRDGAQLVYLAITIMGVICINTGISYLNKRITLDMITIILLGLCCILMFFSLLHNALPNIVFALLDAAANLAACMYLISITTPYVRRN
jgi:hypothetical protein